MSEPSVSKIEELGQHPWNCRRPGRAVSHAGVNPWLHGVRAIHNSYYMVDLFFVLSGFVMNLNYGDRLRNGKDLVRFQLLRLGRLYPVHLVFLLVALLTAASGLLASTIFGLQIPNGSALKGTTVATFVEQLLLVHSLGFFRIEHPLNLPCWSSASSSIPTSCLVSCA